eukprot:6430734-Prymnesium_polylepis.1
MEVRMHNIRASSVTSALLKVDGGRVNVCRRLSSVRVVKRVTKALRPHWTPPSNRGVFLTWVPQVGTCRVLPRIWRGTCRTERCVACIAIGDANVEV